MPLAYGYGFGLRSGGVEDDDMKYWFTYPTAGQTLLTGVTHRIRLYAKPTPTAVTIYYDGVSIGTATIDGNEAYLDWLPESGDVGTEDLTALVRWDANPAPVEVTVEQNTVVEITAPTTGAIIEAATIFNVTATYTGSRTIATVGVYLGETLLGSVSPGDSTGDVSLWLALTTEQSGNGQTLRVRATDTLGGTSDDTITIDVPAVSAVALGSAGLVAGTAAVLGYSVDDDSKCTVADGTITALAPYVGGTAADTLIPGVATVYTASDERFGGRASSGSTGTQYLLPTTPASSLLTNQPQIIAVLAVPPTADGKIVAGGVSGTNRCDIRRAANAGSSVYALYTSAFAYSWIGPDSDQAALITVLLNDDASKIRVMQADGYTYEQTIDALQALAVRGCELHATLAGGMGTTAISEWLRASTTAVEGDWTSNVAALEEWCQQQAGFTPRSNTMIVYEGDSITAGLYLTEEETFAHKVADTLSTGTAHYKGAVHYQNNGLSSSWVGAGGPVESMTTRWTGGKDSRYWLPYTKKLLVFCGGSNDLNGGRTAENILVDLWAIVDAAVAAGASVIVQTVTPRNLDPTNEAQRLLYNAAIVADAESHGATAFDICANPEFATFQQEYYTDLVHPNALGNTIWAGYLAPVVAALLV